MLNQERKIPFNINSKFDSFPEKMERVFEEKEIQFPRIIQSLHNNCNASIQFGIQLSPFL